MLYAKKSNRVQPVTESDIQYYINQGFSIIDSKGNVIAESVPEDVMSLKAAFKRHTEEIAKLRACVKGYEEQMNAFMEINNQLSVENEELKTALEQAEKARAPKTTKASKKAKTKDDEVVPETTEDASST